jgi:hypothetical protein
MADYLTYCPRFFDSDMLTLHRDIFIKNTKVLDRGLGLQHELQPQAAILLKALASATPYARLRQLTHSQVLTLDQLHELLGFFTASGCLLRHRTMRQRIVAWGHMALGIIYGTHEHCVLKRSSPTLNGLVHAICAAAFIPLFSSICLMAIWTVCNVDRSLVIPLSYALGTFWISLIIHELGHCVLLSMYGVKSRILYGPLRIGILHAPLTTKQDLRVALVGPLLGIGSCAIIALLALCIVGSPYAALASLGVSLVHLCSFLPWYGDGKSIWRAYAMRGHRI